MSLQSHTPVSSTSKIRIERREFNNIQEILNSVTYGIAWWKDSVVKFPDKESGSSQAFVEVEGKEITVGYGNRFYRYEKKTYQKALEFAQEINQDWLNSDLCANDFLNELG